MNKNRKKIAFLLLLMPFFCGNLCAQNDTLFVAAGRDIFDTISQKTNPQKTFFYEFLVNEKWGLMDNHKNVIIPPTRAQRFSITDFRSAEEHILGDYYRLNDKLGFLNLTNGVFIPPLYDAIHLFGIETRSFPNPFAAVTVVQNGRYGLLYKETGKTWLPCEYDAIKQKCASFLVQKGKKWGLFHETEGELLPIEYDQILRVYGAWVFRKGKKWGFLRNDSFSGKVKKKSEICYDSIANLNYLLVWRGKKRFLLSDDFKEMPFEYSYFQTMILGRPCGQGFTSCYENVTELIHFPCIVKKGKKFGMIDEKGKLIAPIGYDSLVANNNIYWRGMDFIYAKQKSKWGVIDKNGKTIIPLKYDDYKIATNIWVNNAQYFHLKKGEKWLELDAAGKIW